MYSAATALVQDDLNEMYRDLTPQQRVEAFYKEYPPEEVLVTSSFGTNSAVLLEMISQINPNQKIYFINTGYLFEETLRYRDDLIQRLNLDVVEVNPDQGSHAITQVEQSWKDKPDLCCTINKVFPLAGIKPMYKVWMSGLIGFNNVFREKRSFWDLDDPEILKFHPLIDVSFLQIQEYIEKNALPQHPLQNSGYQSLGCTHCTLPGNGRNGRWQGKSKTECGLHLNLNEIK